LGAERCALGFYAHWHLSAYEVVSVVVRLEDEGGKIPIDLTRNNLGQVLLGGWLFLWGSRKDGRGRRRVCVFVLPLRKGDERLTVSSFDRGAGFTFLYCLTRVRPHFMTLYSVGQVTGSSQIEGIYSFFGSTTSRLRLHF
jgi:hypothetical protein